MMTKRMVEMWEMMVEFNIATEEELGLAVALCGATEETLNNVLFIRTGYRTLKQWMNEEEE